MAEDELMVFGEIFEAVAHTIVSHGGEVDTDEVRKEEGVAGRVPSTVANGHGVGVVCAAPGRSSAVGHL